MYEYAEPINNVIDVLNDYIDNNNITDEDEIIREWTYSVSHEYFYCIIDGGMEIPVNTVNSYFDQLIDEPKIIESFRQNDLIIYDRTILYLDENTCLLRINLKQNENSPKQYDICVTIPEVEQHKN